MLSIGTSITINEEIKGEELVCELLNPIEMKSITISFLDASGQEFSGKLMVPKINMSAESSTKSANSDSINIGNAIFALSVTYGGGELYLMQGTIRGLTVTAE